jgi:uncharacterized protein (DUF433 family)
LAIGEALMQSQLARQSPSSKLHFVFEFKQEDILACLSYAADREHQQIVIQV